MRVGVVYAEGGQQLWIRLDVPEGATVQDAIERSGVLANHPGIDLCSQKVGVFGKVVALDTALQPGDRVEIYRPIICDPTQVPRRSGADDDE